MRLLAFLAAIAVLFALSDTAVAQTFAASVAASSWSQPQTPTAQAAGLRMLTWPGKVNEAPRARTAARPRMWNPEPAPSPFVRPAAPPPQAAALPQNIYAPPPPAPVQQARAAPPAMTQARSSSDGDYQPPHFYSLYREYGQNPDPIPQAEFDPKSAPTPLGPQFFASSTPDLAQPPPPVPHTVTTSGGRVLQSVSPSPDDNPG